MAQYIVNIELPEYKDEDFMALIPEQRAHIDTLMSQGVVMSYSLTLDKTRLWVTINAKNERTVVKTLNSFPMSHYMDYEIVELAFHNTAQVYFPSLSLN